MMYRVITTPDEKAEIELIRYNKTFSKKPIQQLEVIPEYQLLVSLTGRQFLLILFKSMFLIKFYCHLDNVIQVHDTSSINMPVVHQVARTKGATLFTLDTTVNI